MGAGLREVFRAFAALVDLPLKLQELVRRPMWAYQTSMLLGAANSRIAWRYAATASDDRPRVPCAEAVARAPIAKLAARRLTSHSQGPGSVSSKSLMSKTRLALGGPEGAEVRQVRVAAKLDVRPEVGVLARSVAIDAAAPR